MALVIQPGSLEFLPTRGNGPARPRPPIPVFDFGTEVIDAAAAITGYHIEYSEHVDHFIGQVQVRLFTNTVGTAVSVDGFLALRDWPANWDDEYKGDIDFTLFAEVQHIVAPPPRADLRILDAEFNQATQYFRSSRHLDAVHARPDNSIPLVANKPTGVRLYVQYDAGLGLPPIRNLTGLLEVRSLTTGETTQLMPHPSQPNITPREDGEISRAEASHTLNFVIPAEFCRGSVGLRAQVWDAEHSPRHPSTNFRREIQFTQLAPISLWATGIRYMGVPAPSAAEIQSLLGFANRIFPVHNSGFRLRGYSVLTVDSALDTRPITNNECSRGMILMRQMLTDLRGSGETNLHLGVFPAGVDLGQNAGCTNPSTHASVAAADERVIAHEIGHAMPTGTLEPPYLEHPDVLASSGLMDPYSPLGSIGEFGYDPGANRVFNPTNTFDFMMNPLPSGMGANPFGPWISPDNYKVLFGTLLRETTMSGSRGGLTVEPRMGEMLYLGLSIRRDRTVTRRASFHYRSWPTAPGGEFSGFVVEFVTADGTTLACYPLSCVGCHCGCWPKEMLQVVPYPVEARCMLVWEDKTQVYEEEIPRRPKVTNIEHELIGGKVFHVKWEANPNGRDETDLWYLVHWQDDDGAWYGVAPRSQAREATVPIELLRNRKNMKMRILATSGIATGWAEFSLSVPKEPVKKAATQIIAVGAWAREEKRPLPVSGWIEVAVLDGWDRTVSDLTVLWYDEKQRQIGVGQILNTEVLAPGPHTITTSAWAEDGPVTQSWDVVKLQPALLATIAEQKKQVTPP